MTKYIAYILLLFTDEDGKAIDNGSNKKQMILTRLGCYDEVGVCVFCAQFFHVQEDYRPSFSTIVYQEKRALYYEKKRKEEEYWDPLKMMEKDREMMDKTLSSTSLNGALNDKTS